MSSNKLIQITDEEDSTKTVVDETKTVNETNENAISILSNYENTHWDPKSPKLSRTIDTIIKYALYIGTIGVPTIDVESFNEHDKDKMSEKSLKLRKPNNYYYGFYNKINDVHRIFMSPLHYIDIQRFYYDFVTKVNYYLSEGRLLFINNISAGEIRNKIEASRTLEQTQEGMTDLDYGLSIIYNPYIFRLPKNISEFDSLHLLNDFAELTAYIITHCNYVQYVHTNSKINYAKSITPLSVSKKFEVITIPKELRVKLTKFTKYFDELRKILKFDAASGFYVYTQGKINLPIICLHEYMILMGRPLADVSLACYCDGNCKYCGAEMNAYHINNREQLPSRAYELIYKFIKSISNALDESNLTFALHSLILESVKINVDTANPSNYERSVAAFTGLWLYVVYDRTHKKILYNQTKFNKFVDNAKYYWTTIGWTNAVIEEAIKSDIFENIKAEGMIEIIKSFTYPTEITFLEMLPLSILFGKITHPIENNNKPETKIQELWEKHQMPEYNKALYESINKLWYSLSATISIKQYKKINYETQLQNILIEKNNTGTKFFKICSFNWCPETTNFTHEWKSDVCTKCGLKKDKSNEKEIYEKYETIINNNYLQKPIVIDSKRLIIPPSHTIKEIESYKAEELFDKYLKLDDYMLRQALDRKINQLDNYESFIKLMQNLSGIDNLSSLSKSNTTVKKCLCFILDNQILSINSLLMELKGLYFKIDSIDWLLSK